MSKYPIKKEFFPFNHFTPPISKGFLKIAVPFMKAPRFIYKDKALSVVYYSPVESKSFDGLPPAYVETAQYDCLHDDGILYADLLQKSGIPVTLNQTEGTMHGFDIKQNAPTTQQALQNRINFMRKMFKQ